MIQRNVSSFRMDPTRLAFAPLPLIWTCISLTTVIPSACVVPGVITESLFFSQFYSRLKEQSRITRVVAVTNAFGFYRLFSLVLFPSFQLSLMESVSTFLLLFSLPIPIPFQQTLILWTSISTSPCPLSLYEVSMVAAQPSRFGSSFPTCNCFVSLFTSSSSSAR